MTVSTLLRVPVLPAVPRVSLSAPAARSSDMAVVRAEPRVMVSAAEPPVMVSVLVTVAVLAKAPKVSLSAPAAEVDGCVGGGGGEGDDVGAGAAGEGLDVGDGDGLPKVTRLSLSLPAPRSTER